MKKIACLFFSLLLVFSLCIPVQAAGDGNMDGGGGGMGDGDGQSFWNPGDDGVRVSVIKVSDNKRYKAPVDFTNKSISQVVHFGKKSKIDYRGGTALSAQMGSTYVHKNPGEALPQIISSSGAANIEAIKSYFTDEQVLHSISQEVGMDYDTMIGGKYKLLIEPLAYFTYNGIKFAATAHEVALYDQITSGDLRAKLGNLSHKNLPLALFLEESDLGFPAWGGTTNGFVTNSDILSSLGLGIVRFEETPPEGPGGGIDLPDYEYHTDIDVITSFYLHGGEVSPDDGGRVRFTVNGVTQSQSYVIPPDESQLVWFEWRTPKEPQTLTIDVSVSGGGSAGKSSMTVKVVELVEHTPPDPQPRDKKPDSFSIKSPPARPDVKSLSWGVWSAYWQENWVWVSDSSFNEETGEWEDDGEWEDHGKWKYKWNSYNAKLSAQMEVQPDERVPTDYVGSWGKVYMGSGYGVNIDMSYTYTGSHGGSITGAQNAIAFFPEFGYKTYNRVLEQEGNHFHFKENLYSQVRHKVHYTPLWYPDDVYEVQAEAIDCWTPAGMLRVSQSYDNLNIDGTVYDDWRWVAH
ncbi:hypothetical protein U6B65_14685 (plasmid) [Oscillospiraceae bacterium MB08-C2-2]|nr:hypothetical protein U6B65_14685 [Oscillospiraceae bacterium MB08-C2-2]